MRTVKRECVYCDGEGKVEVMILNAVERVLKLMTYHNVANENYVMYHAGVTKRTLNKMIKEKLIAILPTKDHSAITMYQVVKIFRKDGSK